MWEGNCEGRDIIFRIFILPSKAEISPLLRSALSPLYKKEKIFFFHYIFLSPVAILMHEYTWPDGGCLNYGPLTDDGHIINKDIASDLVQFILRPDIRRMSQSVIIYDNLNYCSLKKYQHIVTYVCFFLPVYGSN